MNYILTLPVLLRFPDQFSGHASVTEVNINVYKFTCTRAPRILLMNKFITILREMRPNFAAQYHGKKTDWRTET